MKILTTIAVAILFCLLLNNPEKVEAKPLKRILTIDGGGIRGIIPGKVLQYIEESIQEKTNNCSARLGDYFDFLAGTSTGGILSIAVMKGMSATEVLEIYTNRGSDIFPVLSAAGLQISPRPFSSRVFVAKYGSDIRYFGKQYGIDPVLKEVLGESLTMSQVAGGRGFAITSYDIFRARPMIFTPNFLNSNGDFPAWEVARCTSAAPTYFPTFGTTSLSGYQASAIDGGLIANNPTLVAIEEASSFFGTSDITDFVVLSLGTAEAFKPTKKPSSFDWGYLPWFAYPSHPSLLDIFMSGPSSLAEVLSQNTFDNAGVSNQYVRVNYQQGIDPDLDGCTGNIDADLDCVTEKCVNNLITCGNALVNKNTQRLDAIVDLLIAADTAATVLPRRVDCTVPAEKLSFQPDQPEESFDEEAALLSDLSLNSRYVQSAEDLTTGLRETQIFADSPPSPLSPLSAQSCPSCPSCPSCESCDTFSLPSFSSPSSSSEGNCLFIPSVLWTALLSLLLLTHIVLQM